MSKLAAPNGNNNIFSIQNINYASLTFQKLCHVNISQATYASLTFHKLCHVIIPKSMHHNHYESYDIKINKKLRKHIRN